MALTLLLALTPVAAGVALAALPGAARPLTRWGRPLAIAATLAVVGLVLLPEAWHHLGTRGVVLFGVAAAVPFALERLLGVGAAAGATLGLLSLTLHQVVDGAELGAAAVAGSLVPTAGAVALHSIPLVAAALEPSVEAGGPRAGAIPAAMLLGATAAGVALGHSGSAWVAGLEGWVPAVLAGLLLHPVLHRHR